MSSRFISQQKVIISISCLFKTTQTLINPTYLRFKNSNFRKVKVFHEYQSLRFSQVKRSIQAFILVTISSESSQRMHETSFTAEFDGFMYMYLEHLQA